MSAPKRKKRKFVTNVVIAKDIVECEACTKSQKLGWPACKDHADIWVAQAEENGDGKCPACRSSNISAKSNGSCGRCSICCKNGHLNMKSNCVANIKHDLDQFRSMTASNARMWAERFKVLKARIETNEDVHNDVVVGFHNFVVDVEDDTDKWQRRLTALTKMLDEYDESQ